MSSNVPTWALTAITTTGRRSNPSTINTFGTSGMTPTATGPSHQNSTILDIEVLTSCTRICVPDTRLNLDLADHGNQADGTIVQLWTRWEGLNQVWVVKEGRQQFHPLKIKILNSRCSIVGVN